MSRDFRKHGHKAPRQASINMATDENVTDSLWEDFFSGLVNLLDICEYHSLNVNLDFPSAAILFNQLDITVSVLRSVSDGVANLPCTDQLLELCSFKKNHKCSQFGSTFCSCEWSGKSKA